MPMSSILWAASADQEGFAAAARDAAMEVPINVRRFMGAFYSFGERREERFGGERKGGPNRSDRPPGAKVVRTGTASRTACGVRNAHWWHEGKMTMRCNRGRQRNCWFPRCSPW